MDSRELVRPLNGNGSKPGAHLLRRSRSAGDLALKSNVSSASSTSSSSTVSVPKSLAGLKRQPAVTRAPVFPAKVAKLETNPARSAAACGARTAVPKGVAAATASTKKAVPLTKSAVGTKAASVASVAKMDSVHAPKANEAAGKTNAKTMTKRIPPYDYKARFANLQEKHKALVKKYERLQDCVSELEELKCDLKSIIEENRNKLRQTMAHWWHSRSRK